MRFCYLDESGTGSEPFGVMVGIIVDSHRMHRTKDHWKELLNKLSEIVGKSVSEIHTRDFYAGNSIWRNMDGQLRSAVVDTIFKWLSERKHHFVYSVVDKEKFFKEFKLEAGYTEVKTLWCFLSLHCVLSLQKRFQSESNNKGNFILVFDNEEREKIRISDLILNPPNWTDRYYARQSNQKQLDQVVDVPYFGDSKEVALIQVADFLAYFLRRYVELKEGKIEQGYTGEYDKLDRWFTTLTQRSIGTNFIYPKRNRCDSAELFYKFSPNCIRKA